MGQSTYLDTAASSTQRSLFACSCPVKDTMQRHTKEENLMGNEDTCGHLSHNKILLMKGCHRVIRLREARQKRKKRGFYFNYFSIMECCWRVIHTTDAVKICADSVGCCITPLQQSLQSSRTQT